MTRFKWIGAALLLSGGCTALSYSNPDDDARDGGEEAVDGGDARDAESTSKVGAGMDGGEGDGGSEGGSVAGGSPDAAVFTLGGACDDPGALGCAGRDSALSLACSRGRWEQAVLCDADRRCDARFGRTQGLCLDLVAECEHKQPGDGFCRGNDRMTCGPDRVTATAEPCPGGMVCVLEGGATSCASDTDECALGQDDCDDDPDACLNTQGSYECRCPDGYEGSGKGADGCTEQVGCAEDNGGCDPLVRCTEIPGGRSCGACPVGYRGDGESGCERLWTLQFGTAGTEFALGAVTDASGNLYVAGQTNAALFGDPYLGAEDVFLAKYGPSGMLLWSHQFGTGGGDSAWDLAIDGAGAVYVTGSANGDLEGMTSAGGADLILVKFDATGERKWTREHGSGGYDIGGGVALDAAGDLYIAGRTDGSFDGYTNAGNYDAVLAKYDGAGQPVWTRQFGSMARDQAYGAATDGQGGIYIAGFTAGGLDGNPSAGGDDVFLAKYDASGTRQWTRQFGTGAEDQARSLVADASGIYVIGHTGGDLDAQTNAGDMDQFVAKYDASGNKLWTRLVGTAAYDDARGTSLDADGNLYVSGATEGVLDGDGNAGGLDMIVVKYAPTGEVLWARQLGTAGADEARALAANPNGGVYVTGNTEGGVDGLQNAGDRDVVVFRYDDAGNRL